MRTQDAENFMATLVKIQVFEKIREFEQWKFWPQSSWLLQFYIISRILNFFSCFSKALKIFKDLKLPVLNYQMWPSAWAKKASTRPSPDSAKTVAQAAQPQQNCWYWNFPRYPNFMMIGSKSFSQEYLLYIIIIIVFIFKKFRFWFTLINWKKHSCKLYHRGLKTVKK